MQRTSIRINEVTSKDFNQLKADERLRVSALYRIAKKLEPYTEIEVNRLDRYKLVYSFRRRSIATLSGVFYAFKELNLDHLVYLAEERTRPNEL